MSDEKNNQANEFQAESQGKRTTLAGEFWGLLKHNKKWWLTPILILILLIGLLVLAGGSGVAPFIYALF